jgi:hypothetical protein
MANIAWYKLDGNANESLNNYTGTASGTVTFPSGKIAQSAFFNTGRIDTNIPDSITGTMSISLWFKKTTDNWAMSIGVIGTRNGDRGWMLYRNSGDTAGFFRWYMHYNTTSATVSEYYPWPGISGLTHNRWYHFTIIRESNGASRLYLDGNIVANLVPPANFSSWRFSDSVNVGIAAERAGSLDWNGTTQEIDDVRMYDHALSEYEVKELAKAKVLHYTFNDPNEEPTENLLSTLAYNVAPNYTLNNYTGWYATGVANDNPRFFIYTNNLALSASTKYTFSAIYWSSNNVVDDVYLQFVGTGYPEGNIYLQPFLSAQTSQLSGSSTITDLGNGWKRCSGTFQTTANTTALDSMFFDSDVAGVNVFIANLQLEKKEYSTPYVNGYRGPEVTDSNNIFTGTNAAVYTPYFTITNQSRSVITLTAAAANTIIAMQFSGFDGNFLIGKKMVLTGRMKKNGSPFWHNSNRLNTYHAEADAQMYFDPITGDFTVLEFQSTTSPWIFHCSVTNAIGDVITIENLKIRQILPNESLVRDSSGLNNNGFTNTTLTPRFLNGSSKLGSGSISSTNNFKGVFTTEITDGSSESFSFSIWFKTSISNSNRRPLLTKTNPQYAAAGGTDQMLVCIQDNQPQIHFWGGADPGIAQNVVDGNWHHLAGTYVYSTRLMNLYLDGVKRVTNFNTAESGMLPRTLHRWHIGMNPRPYSPYTQSFDGDIDDVRVFATALSDADMLALYNRRANFDNLGNVSISEIEEGTDSNLITDNLLLHLDPANPACFVSNDSVAYNLVTGGTVRGATGEPGTGTNTPTPSNMPVFNSINGGVFDFAGGKGMNVDDDLGQRTQVTIAMWFYKNSSSGHYFTDARNNGGGWFLSNYDGYNINYNSQLRYNYDATHNASTPNFLNKWIYMVVTSDGSGSKLYLNGQLVHSDASITENLGKNLRIGTRYTTSSQWTGYMGPIMIYGRVLSTSEVTQNYNAHKDRFIDNLYNKQFTSQGIAQFLGIDEVTGTQNTGAQQEIKDNGTLLINGEFSEVD